MDYLAEMNNLADEYFSYDFGQITEKCEAIEEIKDKMDQIIQRAYNEGVDFETLKALYNYKRKLLVAHAVTNTKVCAFRVLYNGFERWRGHKKRGLLMLKTLELFERSIFPHRRKNNDKVDRKESVFIVVSRDEGLSYGEIAELLNRSKSTVHEADERHRERDKEFNSDEEAEKDFEEYLEDLKQPYKEFVKSSSTELLIW